MGVEGAGRQSVPAECEKCDRTRNRYHVNHISTYRMMSTWPVWGDGDNNINNINEQCQNGENRITVDSGWPKH